MKVYSYVIVHEFGIWHTTRLTDEEAINEVFSYVQEYWNELEKGPPPPNTTKKKLKAINYYFENHESEYMEYFPEELK